MVTFAPNLPTQGDPEYLRYSKEIKQPEGSKAGYLLSKGLGDAAEEGIKGIDKVGESYTAQKSLEEFTALEDKHKADIRPTWEYYKGLDQGVSAQDNPNENSDIPGLTSFQSTSTDGSGSLIQKNQDLPPQITNGTKTAQALTERFGNGKLSQTQYDMEIDSLAKNLNSRFPLWQKEVGQSLSKATGRPNANQTVSDMIGDINRIQSQLNAKTNKMDSQIMGGTKDISDPQLRASIIDRHFGKSPGDPGYMDGPTAWKHVLDAQSRDIDQKRIQTEHSILESGDKVDKIKTGRDVNSAIAGIVENWQQRLTVSAGANTWDEYQDKVRTAMTSNDPIEGQKLANGMAASLSQLKAELYKGTRFGARIDPDLNKKIEDASGYFDKLAKDAVGGDITKLGSIVHSAGNTVAAMKSNADLGWYKIPVFGEAKLKYDALMNSSPELAKTYLDTFQSVVKNAGPIIGNHFADTMQSGMSVPQNGTTKPPNMNERINQAHNMGASPQTLQGYINWLDNIKTMPKSQAINTAYMYYGPENIGMVGKWAKDAYNSRTGQTAEGQGTILSKMGDKGVLDKIWSLGDPKLNNHVQSFLEDAVSNRVFPSLMQDLEGTTKFGLAYDNKTQQFMIRNPQQQMKEQGPLSFAHGTSNYAQATQTVKQLNNVSQVVRNLATHLGKDPNAYMVELITANNPNVGKEMQGTPAETENAAVRALSNQVLAKKMKEQNVRLRPDEKPEASQTARYRGSSIKLSSRGDKKQHRKGNRKSRRS